MQIDESGVSPSLLYMFEWTQVSLIPKPPSRFYLAAMWDKIWEEAWERG